MKESPKSYVRNRFNSYIMLANMWSGKNLSLDDMLKDWSNGIPNDGNMKDD